MFHFVNPTNFGLARRVRVVVLSFLSFLSLFFTIVILVTSVSSTVDYFPDDPTPGRNKYLG